MTLYYVDKINDTFSDALLAVGFAKLLQEVLRQCERYDHIVIHDTGSCYTIELSGSVTHNDIQRLKPFSLISSSFIRDREGKQKSEEIFRTGFDYRQEQENRIVYYAKLRELRSVPGSATMISDIANKPHPHLVHYEVINQMIVTDLFNGLVQQWQDLKEWQGEFVSIVLTLFQTPHNDIDTALVECLTLLKKAGLKQEVTKKPLQIINPTMGKGVNRTKANGLTEDKKDSFWILELLKFIGFLIIAAPYTIENGKKRSKNSKERELQDRKTYVLQPRRIELSQLESIMRKFRSVCRASTAVKLDVMASLRFTEAFVEHHRVYLRDEQQQEDEDEPFDETQVTSVARGFEVAMYKDMGSAFATMNISTINFPQWLRIVTLEDAEKTRDLLKEHRLVLQNIRTGNREREEGAEEYELLRAYRNFLSGNDLTPLWTFTTAYSSYLISQREHEKNFKRWLRQLSTTGLEQIIEMTTKTQLKPLSLITNNPGFQRIAYAIRQATVRAQYQRSQERDREVRYDVRYGLGQDLMREVRYREKFIAALSTFLTQYNSETVREEEKLAVRLGGRITLETRRKYKLRGTVAISDIDEIVQLIDDFDAETVGSLLIAYGYASEPRGKYDAHPDTDNGTTSPPVDEQADDFNNPEEDKE